MSENLNTCQGALDQSVSTGPAKTPGTMHEETMNAQHFDVLVIGAGLSGIGIACQVGAAHPNKTIATQTSEIHTLPRKVATK